MLRLILYYLQLSHKLAEARHAATKVAEGAAKHLRWQVKNI